MAKAAYWTITDAEARKRGEQTGLDTLVVHAVNDEYRQERNEYGERKGGCREETEKTERKKRKDRDRVYSGSGSAAWRIFPL